MKGGILKASDKLKILQDLRKNYVHIKLDRTFKERQAHLKWQKNRDARKRELLDTGIRDRKWIIWNRKLKVINTPTKPRPGQATEGLRCIFTNVDGITTSNKSDELNIVVRRENPHVIFITEIS